MRPAALIELVRAAVDDLHSGFDESLASRLALLDRELMAMPGEVPVLLRELVGEVRLRVESRLPKIAPRPSNN